MGLENTRVKAFPYDENNRSGSALFVPVVNANGDVTGYVPHKEERVVTQNFVATGSGAIISFEKSKSSFALQGKLKDGATAFDARLEGSLDGSNYTEVLQATETTPGDGTLIFVSGKPVLHVRIRMNVVTAGAGSVDMTVLIKD